MCGGGSKVEAVNPEAERRKAEAEAAAKANEKLLDNSRRRRAQKGVLASGNETGGSVLSTGGGQAA